MTSPVLETVPIQANSSTANATVLAMIAQLADDDTSLRYYAAWWLGKFGIQADVDPSVRQEAVTALMAALRDEADRTELGGYPLRRNAARALGKLGDLRAVPELTECLTCPDFYVREAAAQALGLLGASQAIEPLLALLAGGVSAAQFVPGRPHLTQPYEAILESLGQLQAVLAVPLIQPFLEHEVERVRLAAARSLCQLTSEACWANVLIQALESEDVQLRRSALLDLGATGYFPAAKAIAEAAVENSFKLIALRGLVQAEVSRSKTQSLTPALKTLFTLLDELL